MADESDYTQMWGGVFASPPGGDGGGVYVLDDEGSVGRNSKIYDTCTRALYEEAHPRNHSSRRYPGPFGAGRASDRVGPALDERDEERREDFAGGSAEYVRGSRALGTPGFRGLTSARGGRRAVDQVMWDNRPAHYAPGTSNAQAHLYVEPEARGEPRYHPSLPGYPGRLARVDRFEPGSGGAPMSAHDICEVVKVVLFFVIVVLAAMWVMVSSAEKRMGRELELALLEAQAAPRIARGAPAQ